MQIVRDVSQAVWPGGRSVVTIGAYDGVHLGHRAVIDEVRRLAAGQGMRAVVVTFDRHPASVVRPESAPKLLTDPQQKLELLEGTGVDATVLISFDLAQAAEPAESFVRRVLVDALGVAMVVVGEDFHFGHDREGSVPMLRQLGAEFDFDVHPLELLPRFDGVDEPISSTSIRRALAGGQVELAGRMLGRPFEARGEVVQGDQRGRLLGFPTANVEVPSVISLPADGVYAGIYLHPDGRRDAAAINLGRRPTFYTHAQHSLLEAHLLDFHGDLYGQAARVQFTHFLRSERKFDGIDALKSQLKNDIDAAASAVSPLLR